MDKSPNTIRSGSSRLEGPIKAAPERKESPELKMTKETVSGHVEGVTEGIEVSTGEISEKQGQISENNGGSSAGTSVKVTSLELPKIEVMIDETVVAIENEIKQLTDEAIQIQHSTTVDYGRLNEVVSRVRTLNSLLDALKNAATLAKDYIVSKWKEFVQSKRGVN